MSGDIAISVLGLTELEKALQDLGVEMGASALKGALMDAARPTMLMAQTLAPISDKPHKGYKGQIYLPGELRKSIRRRSRVNFYGHAAQVEVGSMGKVAGWRAKFVEFGTAPHYTNRGAKRGTTREFSGRRYTSQAKASRMHPGTPARPFMRPAWDANKNQALDIFTERMVVRIRNAHRRAARRAAKGSA